jgi:hypothetical protein
MSSQQKTIINLHSICRWQQLLQNESRQPSIDPTTTKYPLSLLEEENPIQLWLTMIPTSPRTMAVLHPMRTETATMVAARITTMAIAMVTLVPVKR